MDLHMLLFIIGRVLVGGFFIMNGIKHLRNADMMAGYAKSRGAWSDKWIMQATGLMILVGGIGILLGIVIFWSVILLAAFLIGVSVQIHHFWKDTDPQVRAMEFIQFSKNMALLGAILMMLSIPDWTPAVWPLLG